MHTLDPFNHWLHLYQSEDDSRSPFFRRTYSELYFTNAIYNHYIHPQWDEFGSETLFLKVLQVDYERAYIILELFGEWNDCVTNDIMFLKRDVVDVFVSQGISKFIIIGENVLNFHAGGDEYYEEWFQDLDDGWIAFINFRAHVLEEFSKYKIDYFINYGGELDAIEWKKNTPIALFNRINDELNRRLN